jgi:nucleotide-binding universal stress UspA family protein
MRILLAIDGSSASDAAADAVLAQFIPAGTEVCVLHADEWPKNLPPEMAFAEGHAAAEHILSMHALRKHDADAMVADVAQRLKRAGFCASTLVREGDPRHTILGVAADFGADLIVVGCHGRRGLDRLLVGSVSEEVARRAPCSVEIVRVPVVPGAAS